MIEPLDIDNDFLVTSRRRFLRGSSALIGGAVLSGGLAGSEASTATAAESAGNLPPNIPEWMKDLAIPWAASPMERRRRSRKTSSKRFRRNCRNIYLPRGGRRLRISTASSRRNGLFYERHHGGVPAIDPDQHRLMLHGLVDKPLILRWKISAAFHRNHRSTFSNVPATRFIQNLTARPHPTLWDCSSRRSATGVSLKLVCRERIAPEARWLVAEGADAAALTRSIPIEKCSTMRCWYTARTANGCARSRVIRCACCCPASKAI